MHSHTEKAIQAVGAKMRAEQAKMNAARLVKQWDESGAIKTSAYWRLRQAAEAV